MADERGDEPKANDSDVGGGDADRVAVQWGREGRIVFLRRTDYEEALRLDRRRRPPVTGSISWCIESVRRVVRWAVLRRPES